MVRECPRSPIFTAGGVTQSVGFGTTSSMVSASGVDNAGHESVYYQVHSSERTIALKRVEEGVFASGTIY